jgi:hypothetical protein
VYRPLPQERATQVAPIMGAFLFAIPKARATAPLLTCSHPDSGMVLRAARATALVQQEWYARAAPLRTALVRRQVFFPDRRLLQYDCGKLQVGCLRLWLRLLAGATVLLAAAHVA